MEPLVLLVLRDFLETSDLPGFRDSRALLEHLDRRVSLDHLASLVLRDFQDFLVPKAILEELEQQVRLEVQVLRVQLVQ